VQGAGSNREGVPANAVQYYPLRLRKVLPADFKGYEILPGVRAENKMDKGGKKMICKNCGKVFAFGNRPDGIPNGVGFQLQNGKMINLCADCLIHLGQLDEVQKKAFIDRMTGKDKKQ
jgi:hypothetical protein